MGLTCKCVSWMRKLPQLSLSYSASCKGFGLSCCAPTFVWPESCVPISWHAAPSLFKLPTSVSQMHCRKRCNELQRSMEYAMLRTIPMRVQAIRMRSISCQAAVPSELRQAEGKAYKSAAPNVSLQTSQTPTGNILSSTSCVAQK
jgi:hypothetical protein